MDDVKWRFPSNSCTVETGLDTADMETFKKDAISSLARELCQNSIDAKDTSVSEPVKIVFKTFEIDSFSIPGRDDLMHQIKACQDTRESNKKISFRLNEMYEHIKKEKIICLRISDFNTTGLIGISGGDNNPWHYLVHGSGISDKSETSGGSKGIGKFASFVSSYFNTVFYSTRTIKNEYGYEGICKLCSAKIEGSIEKTQGIGYFGNTNQNLPIFENFSIDSNFVRGEKEYGSDVYIIGFKNQKDWKKDIISKVLDSFMSAIIFNTLEVEVENLVINSTTLKDIVFNDEFINKATKKSIISQYLLLTEKDKVFKDVITIDEYGTAQLYLMEFVGEYENYATNNCVMIRYPYMKIKEINKISTIPCSALCIIDDNKLNKVLRNIENPQHTDWEFKRIEDESEKAEVKSVYNELLKNIKEFIHEHLSSSDNNTTDIEGAGDYFESKDEDFGSGNTTKQTIKEQVEIKKKVKPKKVNVNASIEDISGDGVSLDIGNDDSDGEEIITPEGHNFADGGHINPGTELKKGKIDDNGHIVIKPSELRGMNYRFFCISKKERKYVISFVSDYTEKEVGLELFALDDGGDRYPVRIENCSMNSENLPISNETEIKFSMKQGQRIRLEIITDQKDLFSGEIKVYAYR